MFCHFFPSTATQQTKFFLFRAQSNTLWPIKASDQRSAFHNYLWCEGSVLEATGYHADYQHPLQAHLHLLQSNSMMKMLNLKTAHVLAFTPFTPLLVIVQSISSLPFCFVYVNLMLNRMNLCKESFPKILAQQLSPIIDDMIWRVDWKDSKAFKIWLLQFCLLFVLWCVSLQQVKRYG